MSFLANTPKIQRLKKWTLILAGAAVVAMIIAVEFAKPLLFVETRTEHADAIVVLGGESGDRTFKAVEAYKADPVSCIIVSGVGDCFLIRDRLILAGVPKERILLDAASKNTRQNAEFSIKLLRQQKCKRVIIVTSWFHARRALASFKHYGKEMQFYSMPAYHGVTMDHKPSLTEKPFVMHEYIGLVWYWVRSGINPLSV